MRLKVNFSANTKPVVFDNQSLLNSYIHKCLGNNNIYHDKPSHYNISHLYGGKLIYETKTLDFKNGGYIIVSSMDKEFIGKILNGVLNNNDLFNGMSFSGIDHINEVFMNGWNYFATLSPFIVKEYDENRKYKFLTFKDENFKEKLCKYLINKLSKINPKLDLSNFDINIPNNDNHKVKKVMVNNVLNLANQCHISIFSNKAVIETLYNIGLGQSTGSGFGTIYKTENHKLYKV